MKNSSYIARVGMLLALAVSLQFLESLIPIPLPLGVKPGISSVVIMYILMFMDLRTALVVTVLKSGFVFATRGASAFCMSVSGGLLSTAAMWLCIALFRRKSGDTGILAVSAAGGVFHNAGQLAAASAIAGSVYTAAYLPVLVIAGIISGAFTGILMRLLLSRINKKSEGRDIKYDKKAKRTETES